MKKLLTQLPKAMLLLLVMLVFVQANAQKRYAPVAAVGLSDYEYTIQNDVQTSATEMTFELWLKDADASQDFELSIIQAGVLVSSSIIPTGGVITVSLIAGSSQLVTLQQPTAVPLWVTGATNGCIKLTPKSGPGCGIGTIIGKDGLGTRVIGIKITCSLPFVSNSQANLNFNFTTSPYPTKVFQYFGTPCISNTLTMNLQNCKQGTTYSNIHLNPPPVAYTMTGGGAYCEGNPGMPVGLSGSELGVNYTLYVDLAPQTMIFPGTGAALPFGIWGGNHSYTAKGTRNSLTTNMLGSVVVTLNPRPGILFSPTTTQICVGVPLQLEAFPPGGYYSGTPDVTPGGLFTPTGVGPYYIAYNYADPITLCAAFPVTNSYNPIICNPVTPTWNGAFSRVWYDAINWTPHTVPLATDDVIIPAGCPFYPEVSGTVTVYNMTLGGGIKAAPLTWWFDILSGLLQVNGNLTINCASLIGVRVHPGAALTVVGSLTSCSSLLIVENNGSLITKGNVVQSQVTVERFIDNALTAPVEPLHFPELAWHLLSSPVSGQPICNGDFAPTYGIPLATWPGNVAKWDFYSWLPNCGTGTGSTLHWRNLRTDDVPPQPNFGEFPTLAFTDSRGYLVAYGDDFATTKSFIGPPNTGDRTLTFYDVIDVCSWVLPGNPFPSAVDWSQVLGKSHLETPYYYVWNQFKAGTDQQGGYEFWSTPLLNSNPLVGPAVIDGNIPSMQGFFIKVSYGIPLSDKNIIIPNDARVHDVANKDWWLKETPANRLSIKLGYGNTYDEAFVMFLDNSNVGKDRNDAEKMFSMSTSIPQVYTIVDNDQKTALNAMPYSTNGTTIPVGIVAPVEGNYSITVKGIESFSSLTGLSLEDLKLNYTQNLLQSPVYNFTATGNEDAGRFLLHFAGSIGIGEKDNSTINIYSNEKTVFITCAAGFRNAQVTISNLLGQEILTQKLNDQTSNQVKVNALKGYYIVKVQNESSVKTAKVYIN